PHTAIVSCARAIETIRVLIAKNPNRRASWPILRDQLNISEACLNRITQPSTGPRHGHHHYMDGQTKEAIIFSAWEITDRFFEYRKRGDQPLPLSEFPLLA